MVIEKRVSTTCIGPNYSRFNTPSSPRHGRTGNGTPRTPRVTADSLPSDRNVRVHVGNHGDYGSTTTTIIWGYGIYCTEYLGLILVDLEILHSYHKVGIEHLGCRFLSILHHLVCNSPLNNPGYHLGLILPISQDFCCLQFILLLLFSRQTSSSPTHRS